MTLRARLGWGLFAIILVLVIPLLISLRSLEDLYDTSRVLRDREFAASLLLGSFRERTDDTRRAEDALLFIHDRNSATRMQRQIDGLVAFTDSLERYNLDLSASQIRASLDTLRAAAGDEYEAAAAGQGTVAELISSRRTRPAIAAVDSVLGASATTLRNRTREAVSDATNATQNAQRLVTAALMVALFLAFIIAVRLTTFISRPVRKLEEGMHAVSEGDLSRDLGLSPDRGDEFGRLAASYRSMVAQLSELERLRAEFVGVASHELKTPINVMLGYLELLQDGIYGEISPKQREILQTLTKQANSLTRLVKRLLDISRFEASGGKIDARRVDLQKLLTTLESSFSVLAMQREISFSVNHGSELPATVLWDEDRINEVLGNLISNAFKFTPRRGQVSITVVPLDNSVSITVTDSGAGISADQLPHIFDKFYQADNQAQAATKGTGLGLAIAKEIVEAHGGVISVESQVGQGTTFVVTLPVEPPLDKRRRERVTETKRSSMKIFLPALMVVIGTGCAELPRIETGVFQRDWNRTRAETRRNVEAGNYHAADRLLAEFARVHPNTREARESAFWRAAYQVDPANNRGSLETGVAGLDAYLANEPEGWYRNEASILRRTAVAAQGLASGASRAWAPPPDTVVIVTQSRDTPPPPQRSRDEEIAELRSQLARSRTELAQANAELERIKKRLANPSPE